MSKYFKNYMGHRNTTTNAELEEKLLCLMDEYIDSYKAVVIEARMFPVNFPVLTRIKVYLSMSRLSLKVD